MSKFYNHLSLNERRKIYFWRAEKISVNEIAKRLGRHRSTIFRELQRNTYFCEEDKTLNGYTHLNAQEFYSRRRQKHQKVDSVAGLKDFIIDKLKADWSPEQIAGYLKHIADNGLYVCHETIYRYIYSTEGKELKLYRHLFRSRKHRNRRGNRIPRELRGIPRDMWIRYRPDHIDLRKEFGHWEADLMMLQKDFGKANVTTLTERKSRYTVLIKNETRHSSTVMGSIRERLRQFAKPMRQTVTFDRGSEFLYYTLLSRQLNIKSYYCDPRSPWQKGTVENTNSRIRRFLPRNTDLEKISNDNLVAIADRMNNTPRKCLGYRTPKEVLREAIHVVV
jgi:transposase, IS30 family